MHARFKAITGLTAAAALLLAGCSADQGEAGGDDALTVYATTGYLADAVANIAPDAEVTTMVGPGGDPHTYQPSTQDIETIQNSDVVLWNGLHLEAQMIDQLESLGDSQLAVGDQLPEELLLDWPETDDEGNPLHDPHVWNSPEAWSLVVGHVADKLGEIDPDNAEEYRSNAEAYQAEIETAAAEAETLLSAVPEPRILITGHDAFNYFGDTYDLEVHATDFVSTEAALSAEELSELADLIADNEVPVIFQDNQANPQAITSLQEAVRDRGWEVEISDEELYADSLGAEEGVDTYLGVFSHNAQAVADALGDDAE
ncbi:metal ABC transporter solute-binding protein, Zn/Mn family [Gulosibacter sp. 10]|uniref:metal ABC transporter solute-binding protein, Zn/Mn family n=1 Tax=Gulosibacter sp. 10 TaxID=1255570 RepID=UPI00097EDD31|nr:zinc ABC transporter substrate-binding protein [Gulosibacter sp. 10]SJM50106.1 Manganese ABC transporter, periplasmic-binding protein SitA [Gulosibacter sp. 10]